MRHLLTSGVIHARATADNSRTQTPCARLPVCWLPRVSQMVDAADVLKMEALFKMLFHRFGFRLWWVRHNCVFSCAAGVPYRRAGTVTGLLPLLDELAQPKPGTFYPCCYELALVREHHGTR